MICVGWNPLFMKTNLDNGTVLHFLHKDDSLNNNWNYCSHTQKNVLNT